MNIRSMEWEFSIDASSGQFKHVAIEGDRNHVIHGIFAALLGEVEVIDYASRKVSGRISRWLRAILPFRPTGKRSGPLWAIRLRSIHWRI